MAMNLDTAHLIALAAALGWASGLRLYLAVFVTGLAGALGWVVLPPGLHVLESPLVLAASGLMALVEFGADKIPAVNAAWDALHTLVRIPAGAALAAGVFGADQAQWAVIAALLGGALAATSHAAKASSTAALATFPEPFTHAGVSLASDAAVPAMLWLAFVHPLLFGAVLLVVVVGMAAVATALFRFLRALVRRLGGRGPVREATLPPNR
jgi:hypothetical protein